MFLDVNSSVPGTLFVMLACFGFCYLINWSLNRRMVMKEVAKYSSFSSSNNGQSSKSNMLDTALPGSANVTTVSDITKKKTKTNASVATGSSNPTSPMSPNSTTTVGNAKFNITLEGAGIGFVEGEDPLSPDAKPLDDDTNENDTWYIPGSRKSVLISDLSLVCYAWFLDDGIYW
jgi:hypothetical protein